MASDASGIDLEDLEDDERPSFLTAEQRYEAIKGAYRLFRFHIRPFSSLAATRAAKAQEAQQLHQLRLVPGKMVLEALGYNNFEDLLKEAAAEQVMRAAIGLPEAMPQQKKGGKKAQ